MPNLFFFSYLLYAALMLVALVGAVWWRRKKRKTRVPPIVLAARVTRLPGESARGKIESLNDELIADTFVGFLIPCVVILPVTLTIQFLRLTGMTRTLILFVFPVLSLALLAVIVVRMSRRLMERSDWYLGQYGERNVADNLDPLRQRGWRVFHDVPAERNGQKFNVDHVVVGPGGVIAVETKTPRRPEMANRMSEDHIVDYDGEKFRWPTGLLDSDKPKRARARADWLKHWLVEQKVPVLDVFAILAIPWWLVRVPKGSNFEIPAVNPGQLVAVISSLPTILSREQINAISEKLESHCRDVPL